MAQCPDDLLLSVVIAANDGSNKNFYPRNYMGVKQTLKLKTFYVLANIILSVQFYRQFLTQTNSKLFPLNVQTYPQDPYQNIRMVMVLNHFSLASTQSIAVLGLGLFVKING